MIYRYSKFDTKIDINSGDIYQFTFENPSFLHEFLNDIVNKNETHYLYNDKYDEIDFNNSILLIDSIINLDVNNKKMLSTIYDNFQKCEMSDELKEEYIHLENNIIAFMNKVQFESTIPIEFDISLQLKDLFAITKTRVESDSLNYFEELVLYLKLNHVLMKKSIFIICFLDAFLNKNQLDILSKEMMLINCSIFIINNHQSNKFEQNKTILVDNDLCELRF